MIAALPARVDVHCAKIAGSHIMWPVPFVERAEKASDVLAMPPGAFFFWPERQYLEITYDALQAETAAVSYLGRLTDDVGWLRDYADRQRRSQGRAIFTAEIFVPGGRPTPSPIPIAGPARGPVCRTHGTVPGGINRPMCRRCWTVAASISPSDRWPWPKRSCASCMS